ncbi:MAG: dipeptide/oligopeptide/nickel ABC transporter permease/ATP-binding protein [Acidimicrobiia bacterium]
MTIDGTDEVLRYAETPITPDQAVEGAVEFTAVPRRPGALKRMLRRPTVLLASTYLVLLTFAAIFAPLVAPYDPNELDIAHRFATPSWSHLLGTDNLGRDLLSRLIYGARVSLSVCFAVIAIAMSISLVVGLTSGYVGGRTDNVLMRLVDGGLSFPPLVLAIAVAGILGPGVGNVILSLSIVFVFGLTRLVRGTTLEIREEPFVEASRASGSRFRRILSHRVLPNVRSPLLIAATFGVAGAMLAEAGLAYLGLGQRPPTAEWGSMLRTAYDYALYQASWQLLVPGLAIAITILAFTVVGEGLRDALSEGRAARARRTHRRGLTTVERAATAGPPTRAMPASGYGEALLSIEHLSVEFDTERGPARVVEDVSLAIFPGETLGLVGESGSGKTVTSLSVMRLVPSPPGRIVEGSIRFENQDLLDLSFREMRELRGTKISMVFQDPMTSLDPAFTVGSLLVEAQTLHKKVTRAQARRRAIELLELVGIPAPESRLKQYPHQLSGGLRQRVMIAIALANEPQLLIADEPSTALDVTIQAQILDLLRSLQRELGMAVLFVTHDLGVIADLCDRVAVMYAGQIVEEAPVHDLFEHPRHPYTEGLLGAMPQVGRADERLVVIPGQVPLPHQMPTGCHFAARCQYAEDKCVELPVELTGSGGTLVRCCRVGELSLRGAQ